MAKPAITWEGRRALTDNPNTNADTFKNAARELMDKSLLADAATFFSLANDEEALREIAELAVEEGNFFLFQAAAAKLGPESLGREKVEALREAAENSGKALYAERAAKYISEHY
ncbi:hypothetical protein C4J81_17700 [Deltaproteobacteria bacterium Smac51]|nr:hypothetical protein C4J81_17700 [Deltaproteobacteria bacterium Smac51]